MALHAAAPCASPRRARTACGAFTQAAARARMGHPPHAPPIGTTARRAGSTVVIDVLAVPHTTTCPLRRTAAACGVLDKPTATTGLFVFSS